MPDAFIEVSAGLAATNVIRTAIELAAVPSRRRAVAIMDAAMRLHIASRTTTDARQAVRDCRLRDSTR